MGLSELDSILQMIPQMIVAGIFLSFIPWAIAYVVKLIYHVVRKA